MKRIYVVYHGNCLDGYGAAWAAYKLFGDEAEYVPAFPGGGFSTTLNEIPSEITLYMVDIAARPEDLDVLAARMAKVVVIDHHQTAMEWYEGYTPPDNVEVVMDNDHSGAVLSWEYFHREKQAPDLLKYIEDRDLWRWEIPDSEQVLLAIDAYPYTFSNMDRLMEDVPRLKKEGSAILKYRNQMLDLQLQAAHYVQLGEFVVPAANCSIRALSSETGHELLRKYPKADFVVTYRRDEEGKWLYSIRGRGDFDCATFAKDYAGGGGHRDAAGMMTLEPPKVVDAP